MSYQRSKKILQLAILEAAEEMLKDRLDEAENNQDLKEAGKITQLSNKPYEEGLIHQMWIHLETELNILLEEIK